MNKKIIVTNRNGYELDFENAANYMDSSIREELHARHTGEVTEQEFFNLYEAEHEKNFGEEWELSKENPIW